MKKSGIFIGLTAVLMFFLSGCYYDKFQELHPMLNTGCDSASATYSVQVAKVLNTYCVGCHSGASASGGIVLSNFDNVKTYATSGALINALKGNGVPSMPPNTHLDDCKIGAIQHWIKAGTPNN
jgi:mono/diheme cytochrome c family protein